jgi:hypothetical protein
LPPAKRTSRSPEDDAQKQAALRYILDAWEEALHDGIEPEMLANAALFAALADLITVYGEDAVAKMREAFPAASITASSRCGARRNSLKGCASGNAVTPHRA